MYEKDVILGDDVSGYDEGRQHRGTDGFGDKRARVEQIEREELSDEEV